MAIADRYHVDAPLADGVVASVFLASDVRHGRRVAIKVLHPDTTVAFSDVRFVREIKFLARLQHPNILALYDSGVGAGLLYYVMPYVPGETLRARLQRERRLHTRDATRISCQLAGALDYAHRHGIIHRDIKPENILLAETHAMLMDFGIARAIGLAAGEQLTAPLAVGPGTPSYMSPEQFIPGQELDGRTDIYSLGVVVYELLSGVLPFDPAGGRGALMRKLGQPAPGLQTVAPDCPPAIAAVVARALATEPSDRFASAAEFAIALEAASATAAAHDAVPPVPATSGVASPRSRVAYGALAIAIVAGLIALGMWVAASR